MKKTSNKIVLALFAGLGASGCFFGGGDDEPQAFQKVTPGLYAGDYSFIPDSLRLGLSTEISLFQDGKFRWFWFAHDNPVYDLMGEWGQSQSGLRFTRMTEISYINLSPYIGPVEDDTNEVVNVTATSFMRKEWTPLRQKPYWVTYHLLTVPPLKDGAYTFTAPPVDSVSKPVTVTITLDGQQFKYSAKDTMEKYQAEAKWQQFGSVLVTVENRQRYSDSVGHFSDVWDSSSWEFLQKVDSVSATGFKIFDGSGWTMYTKVL